MSDQEMRQLERRTSAGDVNGAHQLDAAGRRAGTAERRAGRWAELLKPEREVRLLLARFSLGGRAHEQDVEAQALEQVERELTVAEAVAGYSPGQAYAIALRRTTPAAVLYVDLHHQRACFLSGPSARCMVRAGDGRALEHAREPEPWATVERLLRHSGLLRRAGGAP